MVSLLTVPLVSSVCMYVFNDRGNMAQIMRNDIYQRYLDNLIDSSAYNKKKGAWKKENKYLKILGCSSDPEFFWSSPEDICKGTNTHTQIRENQARLIAAAQNV